jgi:hypothetical protein
MSAGDQAEGLRSSDKSKGKVEGRRYMGWQRRWAPSPSSVSLFREEVLVAGALGHGHHMHFEFLGRLHTATGADTCRALLLQTGGDGLHLQFGSLSHSNGLWYRLVAPHW